LLVLKLDDAVTLNLAHLPAGTFEMGSPQSELDRSSHENKPREVTIPKPFYMGITEVTQEQYEAIMGTNPSEFKGKKNPVERVSWNDASEFCQKLSAKTGQAVRLPTEAEWEYACRSGTKTPFHTGQHLVSNQANFDGTQSYSNGAPGPFRRRTMPVASFDPNAFGLYDMHGNVAEWCDDKYAPVPFRPEANAPARILRGGSWYDGPRDCRSASRYWLKPDGKLSDFGFRVVVAP
jgi:formylglycine-generating enzyme required for sulfatase activity